MRLARPSPAVLAVFFVATLACGCVKTKEQPPQPDTVAPPVLASAPPSAASATELQKDAGSDATDRMSVFATAAPQSGRSIGTTSLVLKLKLEGGVDVAFKPRSRRPLGATRYKAEVAAYRVARALG